MARLTPAQKAQFDSAGKAFNASQYAETLAACRSLLRELSSEPLVSKFAGEAALQTGDPVSALALVKPVALANPEDWQAASLLARASAESGNKAARDAAMAQMLTLRNRGLTPPNLQQYILERVKVGDKVLTIRTSLVPWGPYNVYDLGQVADVKGQIFLRITLESGDGDQVLFAKEHPKEAAAGQRLFSLDAYGETGLNSAGQRTQTHFTFKMFTGQPTYDTVREEFLKIANGTAKPVSSRTGLVVQ